MVDMNCSSSCDSLSSIDDKDKREFPRILCPLQAADQVLQFLEPRRVHAIADLWAIDLALNESGFLHDLEMLRHRGLRDRQYFHKLAADTSVLLEQQAQNAHANGVSHGPSECGKSFIVRARVVAAVGRTAQRFRFTRGCHV